MREPPEFGGERLATAPPWANMRQKTRSIADLDCADDELRWNRGSDDLPIRQLEVGSAEPPKASWLPLPRQVALLGGKHLIPVIPCPGRLTLQIGGRLAITKEAQHGLFIVWRGVSSDRAQPLGERLWCSQPSAFCLCRYHVGIEDNVLGSRWYPLFFGISCRNERKRRILGESSQSDTRSYRDPPCTCGKSRLWSSSSMSSGSVTPYLRRVFLAPTLSLSIWNTDPDKRNPQRENSRLETLATAWCHVCWQR